MTIKCFKNLNREKYWLICCFCNEMITQGFVWLLFTILQIFVKIYLKIAYFLMHKENFFTLKIFAKKKCKLGVLTVLLKISIIILRKCNLIWLIKHISFCKQTFLIDVLTFKK